MIAKVFASPIAEPRQASSGCDTLMTAPWQSKALQYLFYRQTRRHVLLHKVGNQLAAGGSIDLLSDNDQIRRERGRGQRALDGIVVGHRHPIQAELTRCAPPRRAGR